MLIIQTLTRPRMDSIRSLFLPAQQALREAKLKYIQQHPNDDIAVYLFADLGKKAVDYFSLIGDKAKNGRFSALYRAMENAMLQEKQRIVARRKIVEGAQAPDFTLPDLKGSQITLSSLQGKYVVLDFWGSWCGWCIKGMPQMKRYYEKYKDKLEILGIDCQDTPEKWKEAVDKYQLPWLHVRNTSAVDLPAKYAVLGYPTKIILNPQGKIVKVFVGEDPAFYQFLDSLF